MRSLYSLCYRIGDSFEGVVLVEADSLPAAVLLAELEQLYPGGECEGHALHPDDARTLTARHMLDDDRGLVFDRQADGPVRRPCRPAADAPAQKSRNPSIHRASL